MARAATKAGSETQEDIMSEFGDILAGGLPTIAYQCGCIVAIIAYAIAGMWLTRSARNSEVAVTSAPVTAA
jgi:hypothetical protein